jgi:adenine C2-methylase RlmN of 23S rRNA A2503 and tRNA A37
MKEIAKKEFYNGIVYALESNNGYPIEVTDTFLPYYTKDAICEHQNNLHDYSVGDRKERWMIGVSCMSGCPVRCKFCANRKVKKI